MRETRQTGAHSNSGSKWQDDPNHWHLSQVEDECEQLFYLLMRPEIKISEF